MKIIKKIMYAILIAVVTISNFPMIAHAQTDKVIVNKNVSARVVKFWQGKMINTYEELIYRESDGKYVYCLQPGVVLENGAVVTGYSDEANQLRLTQLSREQLRKVRLIAYYGYGYEGHNSIDWYFATQFLMWTVTETENVPYPAAYDTGLERSTKYDAMFNEITALVNAHPENVSFFNQTYEMKVGETKRITDTNKVLSKFYEAESNDALDLRIDGNDLVVTAKKGYEGTINLNVKENNNVPLIYDGANQICLTAGDPAYREARLNVIVKTEVDLYKTFGNSNSGAYQKEEGAEFEIYDTKTNEVVETLKTNVDGKTTTYLKPGSYKIVQTKGKESYKLIKDFYFTIDGSKLKEEIYFNNEKIKSDLVFTKSDFSTGELLPNTKICIYNADNDEEVFCGRTDDDGQVIIKNIEYGKFYILETKAPEGYTLNDEKMFFEVTEDGKILKAHMKDHKITGTLEFTKMDFSTSEPLPNTKICIYNAENGKEVFCGRTDKDGKIIIKELPYGKYFLLETEAPEGYELNPEKMYFEITEDGKVVKCEMKDKRIVEEKVVKVPDTMTKDSHKVLLYGITIALVGGVIVLYVLTKPKKK